MTSDPGREVDLSAALSALPLFPLPQVVLFPSAMLPLHVFEPRYREMIKDCLASHRTLGVVQVTGPDDVDEHGHPRIAKVCGVGVIVDHAELPEGRFNILLQGRARVQLDELPFTPPYRTAKATVLPETSTDVAERDLTALLSNATSFIALVRERDREFELQLPKGATPSAIADLCAHHLVIDAAERQAILETLSLRDRVRRVTEILALQRLSLTKKDHSLN